MAVLQSSGYSKLAVKTAVTVKPSAFDWLWSENRKLLPTVFEEIQALCGREFTLDAAANDSGPGDHALCTNSCSPSNSFMSKKQFGHIWNQCAFHAADYFCAALLILQATVT